MAAILAGVAVVAYADQGAREGASWAGWGFWIGFALIVVPPVLWIVLCPGDRALCRQIVIADAFALFAVKLLVSPTHYTFHDEFGHLRVTDDILRSGHLFSASPLVQAFPYFPGLDIVTAELVRVSGLSVFTAGLVVVSAAKLVEATVLFELFAGLLGDARIAGLACLIYFANPSFVFFDSQYSYESLAVSLALVVAWLGMRAARANGAAVYQELAVAALVGGALVVTHHMTTYLTAAGLIVVGGASMLMRERRRGAAVLGLGAALLGGALVWYLAEAPVIRTYLTSVLDPAVSNLLRLVKGGSSGKTLFESRAGVTEEVQLRVLALASAALAFLGSVTGGLLLWRTRRVGPGLAALIALALLYAPTVLLRLTAAGTETSTRASAFIFIGVGGCGAAALLALRPRKRGPAGRLAVAMGAGAAVGVMAAGGLIVGWSPYALQPGPFLVSADQRSITKSGVSTALWLRTWVGPHARIAADRENRLLLGSYGDADPQAINADTLAVPDLFFSRSVTEHDLAILRRDRLEYVLVDRRLASGPPVVGAYFQPAEREPAQGGVRRLKPAALAKFAHSRFFALVFDEGAIRIYRYLPDQRHARTSG
jgi:hypothetical protein